MRYLPIVKGRFGIVFAGATMWLYACGAITGATDLYEAPLDDAVVDVDAGKGGDVASPSDASPIISGDAGPPLGACELGVCVLASEGWTPYAAPNGTTCPASWPTPVTYVTAAPMTCECTCGSPSSGSCEGPLRVTTSSVPTSCEANPMTVSFPGDGGCSTGSFPAGTWSTITPNPTNPPSGTCSATATSKGGGSQPVTMCAGTSGVPSARCNAGEVCAPVPLPSATVCVIHNGDVPCPPGYPTRKEIGIDLTEGRTCEGCTCEPGCTDGTLEVYRQAGCSSQRRPIRTNSFCTASYLEDGVSFRYFASKGCVVKTKPSVTGSVTFAGRKTLCCSPRLTGETGEGPTQPPQPERP